MNDSEILEAIEKYSLSLVKSADGSVWYCITPFDLDAHKNGIEQIRYTSPHQKIRGAVEEAVKAIKERS